MSVANECCIYLVGMMGSGKTTVGKILSEVLGYSVFDKFILLGRLVQTVDIVCWLLCYAIALMLAFVHWSYSDKLVEQAVGISTVAQIFKDHSEIFFRDNESNVLRDLSSMSRLVFAIGGGVVIRPINWKYMKQGITIWLDVSLDVLARRIAAVGTGSRPLLHQESGDPYTKAKAQLTALSEQRCKAYANADARVSLENIAVEQGHSDVAALTPAAIAIEALIKIESFLIEDTVVRNNAYIPPCLYTSRDETSKITSGPYGRPWMVEGHVLKPFDRVKLPPTMVSEMHPILRVANLCV